MVPSDIHEKHFDVPADVRAWRLNTCDNLGVRQLVIAEQWRMATSTHLWNDFQPSIDIYIRKAARHRVADFVVSTELEPERK